MNRQFVCETSFAGLRPLGIGGRRIQESWHEIDAALRANLGEDHARLFAEPVAGAGVTSWFAEPEGEAIVYSRLDDAAKRALIARVEELLAAVRARVADLKGAGQAAQRRLGEALERALSVPGPLADREFLYAIRTITGDPDRPVVTDLPVLVNWGTRDDVPDPPLAVLEDFLRGEALRLLPPPAPPEEADRPQAASSVQPAPGTDRLAPHEAAILREPERPVPEPPVPDDPAPDVFPAGEVRDETWSDRPLDDDPRDESPPDEDPPARAGPAEEPAPLWLTPEPAPEPTGTAPVEARPRTWPWWLLLAVLLATIVAMILPTCGVLVPFLSACRVDSSDLAGLRAEGRQLEQQIAALQQQAASLPPCENADTAGANGPPPAGVATPPPPPEAATAQTIPVVPPEEQGRIEQLDRAVVEAGGKVDEVAVTLQWQAAGDLDLRVYCPNGSLIDFQLKSRPQPLCGRGRLDVDANVDDEEISANPIENVSWPGKPPKGHYEVEVHNFKSRPPVTGPVPFALRVRKGGEDRLIEGTVLPGERRRMYEFEIP
ncbi:hypothetical protein [Geminicoccus roseus]|uniref:hypothetical protein n=1 Tax=Geminicoccus roseus TaxID=404900 RepID=UPI0004020DCE|nr:hypothetical protein [Geminicoccus roseus]